MTMNPVHGELSPAMRNRGVEIFVSPSPDQSKQVWPLKHFYLFALGGCVHITYALWMGGWVTKGST